MVSLRYLAEAFYLDKKVYLLYPFNVVFTGPRKSNRINLQRSTSLLWDILLQGISRPAKKKNKMYV